MKIYLVGGAVRDQQLKIPIVDKDWLVVGATVQQMLDLGYTQLDAEFPVFNHPETGEEYALARTEIKQGSGYKGFTIYAEPDVTLEQDLARRDLTINAIAMDEQGNLIDPFHGIDDLRDGKLQHVTDAFVEDPIRLLRIARFASVLGQYGFHTSHSTFKLLKKMSVNDELKLVKPERFYNEMNKALAAQQPWQFFKLLGKSGALDLLLPNSNRWINGEVMAHGEDSPSIRALRKVSELSADVSVRLMTVMFNAMTTGCFDLAKYLPLSKSAMMLMEGLISQYEIIIESMDAKLILQSLEHLGAFRQSERLENTLLILSAVFEHKKDRIDKIRAIYKELLNLSAEKLIQQGFSGAELGQEISRQRITKIDQLLAE